MDPSMLTQHDEELKTPSVVSTFDEDMKDIGIETIAIDVRFDSDNDITSEREKSKPAPRSFHITKASSNRSVGGLRKSASFPVTASEHPEAKSSQDSSPPRSSMTLNKLYSSFSLTSVMSRLSRFHSEYQLVETGFCGICLENCPLQDIMTLSNCQKAHCYCRSCMIAWATSQINEGIVHIQCPGAGSCNGYFLHNEIRDILPSKVLTKYERFFKIKYNPQYRECPKCQHGCSSGSIDEPLIVCSECGCEYCFVHTNAHPGQTCQEYSQGLSKHIKKELKESARYLQMVAKACPRCNSPTEKSGGCNHM